jgi:hypothetical protein
MKIYDCFTFFNELDLLEIRLQELYDVVDYFVIVESDTSFRGNPKPFYLQDNWQRFNKFHDKIRYIQVANISHTNMMYAQYAQINQRSLEDAWTRERWQRDCISRALHDATLDDWVIISDCDEILRSTSVAKLRDITDCHRVILKMPLFYYKVNYINKAQPTWAHTIACKGAHFTSAQQEREFTAYWLAPPPANTMFLDHAGWHFSYLGDNQQIIHKIQNFAHSEHDNADLLAKVDINKLISSGVDKYGVGQYQNISITDYWPSSIYNNLRTYSHWISPSTDTTIFDIYP